MEAYLRLYPCVYVCVFVFVFADRRCVCCVRSVFFRRVRRREFERIWKFVGAKKWSDDELWWMKAYFFFFLLPFLSWATVALPLACIGSPLVCLFSPWPTVDQKWMTRIQSLAIDRNNGLKNVLVRYVRLLLLLLGSSLPCALLVRNEWHGFNPNESNNGPLVYQVVWDVCLFLPVFSLPCTLLVGNEWHKFGPNEGKKVSVTFEHLASKPHKTKIILDFKTKRLWSKHIL